MVLVLSHDITLFEDEIAALVVWVVRVGPVVLEGACEAVLSPVMVWGVRGIKLRSLN